MFLLSYEAFGVPPTGFDLGRSFVRSDIVSPSVLAGIRILISIYIFTSIVVAYAWQAGNTARQSLGDVNIDSYIMVTGRDFIGKTFSYFTFLTWWSMGFYFAIVGFHTIYHARRRQPYLHRWPKVLQLCHSLFYSTIVTFPFLVTIAYWGTLWGRVWIKQRYVEWLNLTVHALNSVFALEEIILPATSPPPPTHLSVVLLILSLYLGLAYLTKATQDWYVYEWMNPAHGDLSIVLHVFSYAAVMIAIFVAVWGGIWLRKKITNRPRKVSSIPQRIASDSSQETAVKKGQEFVLSKSWRIQWSFEVQHHIRPKNGDV
ncbi:hypothetical protein PRZ48_012451 [Zasmidium cellare]|uniref:FAR-17a/AIG1-like protein n=1 Tax=Zasmidium cellare TaxID=395010 RepID=A0ABR0E4X6_ZASCE|nr:hypothetical protein PRZ48_012451 [Zasmidium cellare]